jgi:hypothetical protein
MCKQKSREAGGRASGWRAIPSRHASQQTDWFVWLVGALSLALANPWNKSALFVVINTFITCGGGGEPEKKKRRAAVGDGWYEGWDPLGTSSSAGCSANAIEIAAMGTSSNSHELVDWLSLSKSTAFAFILTPRKLALPVAGLSDFAARGTRFLISEPQIFWQPL